jgi:hypothetical protein|tara:strand:- start:18140 stop:18457 length:318 start_codon:yes stop_codon:yes gene_type:complete
MSKLPTIKLRHKRTGRVVKLNQTDYARDIAKWFDWKVVYIQQGDATDAEVEFSKKQSNIEKFRREDSARQAWSGDKQRAFEQRAVQVGGVKIKPPVTAPVGKPLG